MPSRSDNPWKRTPTQVWWDNFDAFVSVVREGGGKAVAMLITRKQAWRIVDAIKEKKAGPLDYHAIYAINNACNDIRKRRGNDVAMCNCCDAKLIEPDDIGSFVVTSPKGCDDPEIVCVNPICTACTDTKKEMDILEAVSAGLAGGMLKLAERKK